MAQVLYQLEVKNDRKKRFCLKELFTTVEAAEKWAVDNGWGGTPFKVLERRVVT